MKKTIFLIIVNLLILCCVFVFLNDKIFEKGVEGDEIVICPETVSSISVENANNVKFSLSKKNSKEWTINTGKLQCNANIFAVDNLLFELSVESKNGTISFKSNKENQSDNFVRINVSGKEYIIYCERESVLEDMIKGDVFQFVDSKVFGISAGITEILVKVPEMHLENRFVRRSDVFFLDYSAQLPIDSSLMSNVISHVKMLHFTGFSDQKQFLDKNVAEIKIYDSKSCESIKFVRNGNRIFAIKDDVGVAMELDALELTKLINSVRAAASVNVLPNITIDTIEVFGYLPTKEFFLQKLEEIDVWNLITKNNGKIVNFRADSNSVSELIDVIRSMKSVNILEKNLVNLSEFHKKTSVNLDGERLIKFDILEDGDTKICILNDSKFVFETDNSLDAVLSRGPSFFRDKTLFSLPFGSNVLDVSISKIDSDNESHYFVASDDNVLPLVNYANRFIVSRYIENYEIIQRAVKFDGMTVALDYKLEFSVELAGVSDVKIEKFCIKFNRPKFQGDKMFGYYEIQGTFFECTDDLKSAILSLM